MKKYIFCILIILFISCTSNEYSIYNISYNKSDNLPVLTKCNNDSLRKNRSIPNKNNFKTSNDKPESYYANKSLPEKYSTSVNLRKWKIFNSRILKRSLTCLLGLELLLLPDCTSGLYFQKGYTSNKGGGFQSDFTITDSNLIMSTGNFYDFNLSNTNGLSLMQYQLDGTLNYFYTYINKTTFDRNQGNSIVKMDNSKLLVVGSNFVDDVGIFAGIFSEDGDPERMLEFNIEGNSLYGYYGTLIEDDILIFSQIRFFGPREGEIILIRIDSDLDQIIWKNFIQGFGPITSQCSGGTVANNQLMITPQNNIIIVGSTSDGVLQVAEISGNDGSSIWSYKYPSLTNLSDCYAAYGVDFIENINDPEDFNFYVVGALSGIDRDYYIAEFEKDGSFVNMTYISESDDQNQFFITKNQNRELLTVGSSLPLGNIFLGFLVSKYKENLNHVWTTAFGETGGYGDSGLSTLNVLGDDIFGIGSANSGGYVLLIKLPGSGEVDNCTEFINYNRSTEILTKIPLDLNISETDLNISSVYLEKLSIPWTETIDCIITKSPTSAPTSSPSVAPSGSPSQSPTITPSFSPTLTPTGSPSQSPTLAPTGFPTESPTLVPTSSPTFSPTKSPTKSPTISPTSSPTDPTENPTNAPTHSPTQSPSGSPSQPPTLSPSHSPTFPTTNPTNAPTLSPSLSPTDAPTESGDLTVAEIAGISVGGAILIILIALLIAYLMSRYKQYVLRHSLELALYQINTTNK